MTRFEQDIEEANRQAQIEYDEFEERQNYGTYDESITLYYYMNGDETGTLHRGEFDNQSELNEFLEIHGDAIEIFEIRY